MKCRSVLSLVVASFVVAVPAAEAGALTPPAKAEFGMVHLAGSKTPGARVKGFTARGGRGGYSYYAEDSINTYGDARTKYGSASSYRDPALDRQTAAGPFDHGFFFDSAIGPRGGDSPYMN
jgi:hypothetical protein